MPSPPVALFTHEFLPFHGGIAIYCAGLAEALAEAGRKVTVWAPDYGKSEETFEACPVRRNPWSGNQRWPARLAWMRAVARSRDELEGADWVVAEPGPLLALLYRPSLARGCRKLTIIFHGTELRQLLARPHRRFLFSRLLPRVDRVGAVSNAVREIIVRAFPSVAERSVVVPGVPRFRFEQGSARSEGNGITILTVGRIHPRKGQMAVARALGRLPDGHRERVTWRLVGPAVDSGYLARVWEAAEMAGIRLEITGDLSDGALPRLYREADIFALASKPMRQRMEGLGLVFLEASAGGLPVVAHRTGGVAEAVIDGETGLLVDPGDSDRLTDAIARLIDDGDLRRRLGEAGRAHAAAFNWPDNLRKLGLAG